MAKTVTRANLRTAVRNRGEFRAPYITDSEINNYINISLAHLYDIIISADPTYYLSESVVSITSGTRSYALPSDFYKCVGVALYDATAADDYHTLDTFNFEERWDDVTLSDNNDTRYEIRGTNIMFHPTPTFTTSAILEYIPTPTSLDDDVTTWDSVNLWTEWVVMDVLIACGAKEESDVTVWIQQREKLEKRIRGIGKRDLGEPKTSSTSSTLRDLRHAVRNRGSWDDAELSNNQITSFVNTSLAALRDLVAKNDPSHFLTYSDISVSSGTREYSLPATFYKIVGVSVVDAGATDGYSVMEHFNWEERYDDTFTGTLNNTRYHIRGDNIYFHPEPTWSGTVRLEFIPTFTELSDPTDTFDLFNHWHEWVILDAAVKCCAATGKDPQIFLAQLQKTEERIESFSAQDLIKTKTTSTEGTLQALQLSIRNRGGWTKEQLNDSQLTAWINSSISGLRDMLIQIDPTYLVTEHIFTITSGTREYSVPSDFLKVVGVDAYDSAITDGYSTLEFFNWNERYDTTPTSSKTYTRWHIRGETMYLHPTPTWSGTVKMEYIPETTALTSPTDAVDLYNDWQEWVVLDCCVKAAAYTSADPQVYMAQQQAMEKRIREFSLRDLAQPTTTSADGTNLHSLQLAVRNRGNWPKTVLNDSQLTAWINSSISAFIDLIAKHDPAYYLSRSDISVTSGTREYSLPSDFYKLHGVAVVDDSKPDGYSVMERVNFDERYDYWYSQDKWTTRYMIRGTQIHFHPTPNWTETVRLEYIPIPTALAQPTDTFTFYNNWQEWVILDVCRKVCALLSQDASVYVGELSDMTQRIIGFAEIDVGKPKTVVDFKRLSKYDPRFWWRR